MLNKYFVSQGVKLAGIENFIRAKFPSGDYSMIDLQTTPLGIKIVIYTNKPGKIIGRGGKNIDDITESLRKEFNLENPQIDVKEIRNPDLDSRIVAKQIKSAIEKGYSYKKIGNLTIKRIMDAGAMGAQIIIAGKVGGGKAMTTKFMEGHIKHSGDLSRKLVDEAFEDARTKPGTIGIRVRIMVEGRDITGAVITRNVKPVEKEKIEKEIVENIENQLKSNKAEDFVEKAKPKKKASKKDGKEVKKAKKPVAKKKEETAKEAADKA